MLLIGLISLVGSKSFGKSSDEKLRDIQPEEPITKAVYGDIYQRIDQLLPKSFDDWGTEKRISWLTEHLYSETDTSHEKGEKLYDTREYVLNRLLFLELFNSNQREQAQKLCANAIYQYDFVWRIMCGDVMSDIQTYETSLQTFDEIINDASNVNDLESVIWTYNERGWLQSTHGLISEALQSYQYVLNNAPREYSGFVTDAYINTATLYIIYGDEHSIYKGIELLKAVAQLEAPEESLFYTDDEKVPDSVIEVAMFNIGLAYALQLNDYYSAITYLERVLEMDGTYKTDALVFLALSKANVGKPTESKRLLEEANVDSLADGVKRKYLNCYGRLTTQFYSDSIDLSACFQLPLQTPVEVRRDILKRLIASDEPDTKQRGLELFYQYYTSSIEPELKKRTVRAASATEVSRFKLESELKGKLLENEKRLKLNEQKRKELQLWIFIGCFVVLIIFLWMLVSNLRRKSELANRLKEINEAKTRFFTNISHEFRTAVTLAVGPLKLLLQNGTVKQSDDRQLIESSLNNNLHMMHLINQFLDIERLESGSMPVNLALVDVSALLDNCLSRFSSQLNQDNITVESEGLTETCEIYFDPDHMDKILTNIISNAIKYSEAGSKIKVSLRQSREEYVDVSIQDSGLGIDENEVAHIFDRFYQGKSSSSLQKPGTGVGLSLVNELVKLHCGEIQVTSQKNVGTEFLLSFRKGTSHYPKALQSQIVHLKIDEKASDTSNNLSTISRAQEQSVDLLNSHSNDLSNEESKPVILVVDDNAEIRLLLKRLLQSQFIVYTEEEGRAAFKTAISLQPDLIVSDIMMPVMDGLAFTQHVKSTEETQHIPIILLSAKATKNEQIEGLLEGADDYLTKPFSHEELLARVGNQIASRKRYAQKLYREFLRSEETSPLNFQSSNDKFVKKVNAILDEHLSNDSFNVSQFAELLNVSQSKLLRLCKKHFECSPVQLIKQKRLQYAQQLLKQKQATVSEVAYAVGFQSLSAFSRAYADFHGVTPSADKTAN